MPEDEPPPPSMPSFFARAIPSLGGHLTLEHEAVVTRFRVAKLPDSPETRHAWRQTGMWVAAADTAERLRTEGAAPNVVAAAEAAEAEAARLTRALVAEFDEMHL